jgi:GAF domain-containing protein
MLQAKEAITLDDVSHVMACVAGPSPDEAYRALDALAQRVFGHKLLTVLVFRPETVEVERLYSSNTQAYPVGGSKQKKGTPWGERVLDRGEFYIAKGPDDIKWAFSDHELIASLGITGMINVPILFEGRCIGTLNISHDAGRFTEADFPVARILAGLVLPLVLARS